MTLTLVAGLALLAQQPAAAVQGRTLFGEPLFGPKLTEASMKSYQENLDRALADWNADKHNVDKYVWVGRRMAYLGKFKEAAEWFGKGRMLNLKGTNVQAKLLRHLGHRYISLRDFDKADKALEEGLTFARKETDEVEPDGIPNARNTPIGTVHSNIYYHLGLAKYLVGQFADAAKVYEESQSLFSGNSDRFISTAYWQALSYMKLGDTKKLEALLAKATKELDVIENQTYHRLLLHFKGAIPEAELLKSATGGNDFPTARYGVAAWRLHKGRTEEAIALLKEVLRGEAVYAFGYIAAEAELKRLNQKP